MTSIPVVDFDGVFSCSDLNSCPQVEQLHSAFTTVGFVFITNHGIQRKLVDDALETSATFFRLAPEIKNKYGYNRSEEENSGNDGYRYFKQESLDVTKPAHGDLKESFDMCDYKTTRYPDEEVPQFKPVMSELYEECLFLSRKLMEMMGYALKLNDPLYFQQAHQKMGHGSSESYTNLRVLYYPPIPPISEIKPGQIRCGEHIDYGSITLLFQDPNGGLQVKQSDGKYIDVPYRPDAVLVNLGAQLEHWTNAKYPATPHRVLIPEDDVKKRSVRQCVTFFVHPDNDVVMECIDGTKSEKYPAVTAKEATDRRINAAITKKQ